MKVLRRLMPYMTGRKALLPLSLVLSATSSVLGLMPFVFIWLIVRDVLYPSGGNLLAEIGPYAAGAAVSAICSIILYFFALSASHFAAFRVEVNMRKRAMERLVRMPLGFFDSETSGRIRKVVDDNAGITHSFLAHQMPDLAGTFLVPIAAAGFLFLADWRLGVVSALPVAASMMLMGFMMGGAGKDFMRSYMTSLEKMNAEAVEYVRGIPVVKVFQQTVYSFKSFHDSIVRYRDMVSRYTRTWKNPMSLYTVAINGFAFVLVPSAILLMTHIDSDPRKLILNMLLYILVTPVFSQIIMKSMYLNQAMSQADEAVSRMENLLNAEALPLPASPGKIRDYSIEFKNVSFRYPGSEKDVLDNISFSAPAGSKIALVGPSGGGKTTIARLLPRFWDVRSGSVLIGGRDVRTADPRDLMDKVSFVFQNTRLFKTTLMENIAFGKPSASRSQIERAANLAQCGEILDRLPQGLSTRIGADGTYLSGGEQQRISLARTILKDAPIVVLDEATAFADPENEYLIQQALAELTRGKTVLMIAHRLTSVRDADLILVVDEGRIVQRGTHEQLIAEAGTYASLWDEYQKSVQWSVRAKEDNDD